MRKFFLGLFFLVVLLGITIVIAPQVVPTSTFKPKLEAEASKALGRNVSFGDDLTFQLIPIASFRVTDLKIANAEGFKGKYLAEVEEADIGVRIMPLFQKTVEINRFVLTRPDLTLQRAKSGKVNWSMGEPASVETAEGQGNIAAQELKLGDVRIIDGKATYTDGFAKKTYTAEKMNLTAKLASLDTPMALNGDLVFQGSPSTINLLLTTPRKLMNKQDSSLKLDFSLASTSAAVDLILQEGEEMSFTGPVRFDAPNLPQFARIFDVPLQNAPGFDRLSISGNATGTPQKIRIAGAAISFDDIKADGDLTLDLSRSKPKATGTLSTNLLDVRPYMPPPATDGAGFPAWSEAKMDFTSLRNIDADLNISADKIFLNDLKIDQSRMKLKISSGRMTADIPEIAMYGGAGSGHLVVNARAASPSLAGEFDFGAVQAQPFTIDMIKMDRLLGLGGLTLKFSASGSSQAAIMRSIDGNGSFDLADGALKGVNIAKLARAAASFQEGFNPTAVTQAIAQARGPDQTTDFSKFLSNFTMSNGLVSAPSITLEGPYLTMTGSGTVNLPNQSIDIRLAPRASTSIDGSTGRMIAIPVRVSGTFNQPKMSIDAESLVRGRVETGVRDILGGVLGSKRDNSGSDDTSDGNSEEEEDLSPGSILRGVLGGGKSEASPPADDQASSETSVEEDLADAALNQIFGSRKSSGTDQSEQTGND